MILIGLSSNNDESTDDLKKVDLRYSYCKEIKWILPQTNRNLKELLKHLIESNESDYMYKLHENHLLTKIIDGEYLKSIKVQIKGINVVNGI